uniref:Putative ovule protein n=1 Tax=Solanum chacoense TaxID=4108 RepID=A0A0V0GLL1_SOLCH
MRINFKGSNKGVGIGHPDYLYLLFVYLMKYLNHTILFWIGYISMLFGLEFEDKIGHFDYLDLLFIYLIRYLNHTILLFSSMRWAGYKLA